MTAPATTNPCSPPWLRALRWAALSFCSAWGILSLLFFFFQDTLIYAPDPWLPPTPRRKLRRLRKVTFTSGDGVRLVSWWLPPPPGRPTLIYFQGSGGNMAWRGRHLLEHCQDRRWGGLLLGFRGYGESQGSPDEAGLNLDGRAALEWLRAQPGVDMKKIVYFGESLGCAVALKLSISHPPACVVCEMPFKTLKDLAAVHFRWIPASRLVRDRFDNMRSASRLRCPLFVAHGACDAVVPFDHGKAVHDAARVPKRFYELRSGHCDLRERKSPRYRRAVADFIEDALARRGPARIRRRA